MNYFEFYAGDYSRDTAHLSLAEHGAFLLLLSAYYSTEKPLTAAVDGLYRIARAMTPAEQKAVRSVAEQFFPVGADGLRHNDRADREIEKAVKRIETARDNGKRGGRPPKREPKENPAGFDSVTQPEPAGKAPQTPHAISPPDTSPHTPPMADGGWGSFEGHEAPQATPSPAAAHSIALRANGFACTPMNPHLLAFVQEGGTVEHLKAVMTLPACAGKEAGYVIKIARRELAEHAQPIKPGPPHETHRKLSASEQTRADIAARRRAESADALV